MSLVIAKLREGALIRTISSMVKADRATVFVHYSDDREACDFFDYNYDNFKHFENDETILRGLLHPTESPSA